MENTMKNPRHIRLTSTHLQAARLNTSPPPQGSLFWNLWNNCISIAEQALSTTDIQGIGNGTLDPNIFGSFNVNDAYYFFNGASDYETIVPYANDPTIAGFLQAKFESYQDYN